MIFFAHDFPRLLRSYQNENACWKTVKRCLNFPCHKSQPVSWWPWVATLNYLLSLFSFGWFCYHCCLVFVFPLNLLMIFIRQRCHFALKRGTNKEENQVGHMVTWKHYSNINIFTTGLLSAHIWKRLLIHDTRLPSPWLMVIILLTLLLLLLL